MEEMTHNQLQQAQPRQPAVEGLSQAVQQQLNLEQVKIRAISLSKAIARILEYAHNNTNLKWQDILGQYSMVNLELFNIVDEIKKMSKAFVIHPKNVSNAGDPTIIPAMLSSKLPLEREIDGNSNREQLLEGMQNLPVTTQIEKLNARIDMIAAACDGAEKVLADTRKAYDIGTRQGGSAITLMLDKGKAAKIQEQESLLRAAVNSGEGLRLSGGQRHITSALPMHLADALVVHKAPQPFTDVSGMYMMKNTSITSNNMVRPNSLLHGAQHMGGSAPSSPSGISTTSFENATSPPLPYANSPGSSTNMMNTPSPQQQPLTQQPRQKPMQLPQRQQQQLRQSAMQGTGQKYGQYKRMQFSQFQCRQPSSSAHIQHGIGQSQRNEGRRMNHMRQFSGPPDSALLSAAQARPNTQMITPNISGATTSQSLVPQMQYGLSRNSPQRNLPTQMLNIGRGNLGGMIQQQRQRHSSQGAYGSTTPDSQNLQPGFDTLKRN